MDTYAAAITHCKELNLQGRLEEADVHDVERYVDYLKQNCRSFFDRVKLALDGEYRLASRTLEYKMKEKKKALNDSLECLGF